MQATKAKIHPAADLTGLVIAYLQQFVEDIATPEKPAQLDLFDQQYNFELEPWADLAAWQSGTRSDLLLDFATAELGLQPCDIFAGLQARIATQKQSFTLVATTHSRRVLSNQRRAS